MSFCLRFLGSDINRNLFVCQRLSGERVELSEVGRIHVGDSLNVFRHGSLPRNSWVDTSIPHTGSILFG